MISRTSYRMAYVVERNVHLAVYADDTTLYVTIESQASVASSSEILQAAVDALERWGREWFITFEPTKSQCLTLTRHRVD